ncbi:PREDICTED: gamma-interferon-inducible lysosomal thiol reductase [Tarenaya hassleriana]|uniref:gamma-interferon-inducible lysosomal thiol reductase n=1 Tax=Tarenaya hassleriana TaxID=28532 RepID=UPI00053C5E7C|nr:PREDICTED: gamma-interferon-inducible lysosomal thiol reductase [Tarenaya hassleriana]
MPLKLFAQHNIFFSSSPSSSPMADHGFFRLCLAIFTIFFCLKSPCLCQKVTLSLYYETLCPYCADFIVNHLANVFENGLISIIDLRLVPWGNALIRPDRTFVCQHGDSECALNIIHACAINAYPDVEKHFPFIYCAERLALENRLNEWVNCLDMAGLSRALIDCYTNGYGNLMEQRYAEETSELKPPHQFVPWVVMNNQPLQKDYQNFMMYVCKAYGGNQVPEVCSILNSSTEMLRRNFNSSVEKLGDNHLVCYATDRELGSKSP